jgi:hypothetical protein
MTNIRRFWQPGRLCFLTNAENERGGNQESVETCLRHPFVFAQGRLFGASVSTYRTEMLYGAGSLHNQFGEVF